MINGWFNQVGISLIAVSLGLAISVSPAAELQSTIDWQSLTLRDAKGDSIEVPVTDWKVVCFLGTECPLAKLYGGRLQLLADEFDSRGVTLLGVNSNAQDSPTEIVAYAEKHGIEFPIAKDADQSIAIALNATRTPEVFVIDPLGIVRYQGRIDDQYEPGIARAEPTRHDLRDAITNLIAGQPLARPAKPAVGCLITRIKSSTTDASKPESAAAVTFTRDIAPILNEHCVECHRAGEIGPFELSDYDEVVGWGQMMLEVIDNGRMPPWHADPSVGHFLGERRMPEKARDTIARWVDAGMPEGDSADLPTPPTWNAGWHLANSPDTEIAMRDRPFKVPSEGVVEYQYFVVDPQFTTDQWVTAAQVVPGSASVVHHAIVFVRPPDGDGSRGIGWLGAYVPGQRTVMLPPGHARRIPAGSKLVFQMHYTPNGSPAQDATKVGVWLADPKQVTHEVYTNLAVNHEFEIPPGEAEFRVSMQLDSFPTNGRILGATPHMHVRGKSFEMTAVDAAGKSQPLLRVPHYDFNWQHWYAFAQPIELDDLESIDMTVTFDNSSRNPTNPAPEEYVTWGDQTFEEMAIAFFDVAVPRDSSGNQGSKKRREATSLATDSDTAGDAEKQVRVEAEVEAFLAQMDSDADGIVTRDEAPIAFLRFGFGRVDRNGDGVIDRDEIERSAADRL